MNMLRENANASHLPFLICHVAIPRGYVSSIIYLHITFADSRVYWVNFFKNRLPNTNFFDGVTGHIDINIYPTDITRLQNMKSSEFCESNIEMITQYWRDNRQKTISYWWYCYSTCSWYLPLPWGVSTSSNLRVHLLIYIDQGKTK